MNDLFEFSFRNLSGFLIAFVPGLVDLGLVVYILFFLPQNRITRVFLLLTISIVFWQLADAIQRITLLPGAADAWDCIFSPAWLFIGPLSFQFSLLYYGNKRTERKTEKETGQFILLYLPAFIFMGLYGAHVYPHRFHYIPYWGWVNYHDSSIIDIIQLYWISALALASAALLFLNACKARKDKDLKYQSLLIGLGISIPVFVGILTEVIFPILLKRPPMPLASSFMTAFSIATVIALKKYHLFSVKDFIGDELIMEALPVVVMHISGQKRITYINRFGMDLLGVRRENVSELKIDRLLQHPSVEEEEDFRQAWERAIGGEQQEIMNSYLKTEKGRTDILLSLIPVLNNGLVNGVLFIAKDITELKESYQRIRDNESMLIEAQQLSHIGSWKWDIRKNKVGWSDELFRIYGYAPGEIEMSYEAFLEATLPEDRSRVGGIIQQAFLDHQPFTFFYHIRKKDGTVVILHSRGRVVADGSNEVIRMDGTCQDVTESRNREKILEEQNLELQKINLELDRFVYSASHDLRGPLASIMGIVNIAELETSDPASLSYLGLIRKSVGKLDKFILDILDYSRNARTTFRTEEIDFGRLLEEVAEDARFVNSEPGRVKINVHVEQSLPFQSDRTRLSMILHNLIVNAIYYHNPEATDPYVDVSIIVSNTGTDIIVSDNGIGIKKEQQGKIFEMFYRGSEKSKGSGLGLYIVKETVQKLEGCIILESTPGEGSTFRIHLPVLEPAID